MRQSMLVAKSGKGKGKKFVAETEAKKYTKRQIEQMLAEKK